MQKLITLQEKYQEDHSIFDQLLLEYEKVICKNAELAIKLNLVDKLFLIWKQQLQDKDQFKRFLISSIGSFNLMSLVYLHELPAVTNTFHVVQLEHCICLKKSSKALPSRQLHAILLNKIYSALADVHRYYNKELDQDNTTTECHYSSSALHYFSFDGKALNQLGMYYQYEAIKRPEGKLQNGIYTFYFYLYANLTPYPFKKAEENLQHFIKMFLGLIYVDVHPYSKLLYLLFKWFARQAVDVKETDLLLLDSMDEEMQNIIFKCCIGLFHQLKERESVFYGVLVLFLKFNQNVQLRINYINFIMAYHSELKQLLLLSQIRTAFDQTVALLHQRRSATTNGSDPSITVYDFDLVHLRKIGQLVGEIALQFAETTGITDDQDLAQLAVNNADKTGNDRIEYFLGFIDKEKPVKIPEKSNEDKFINAISHLKTASKIIVILTEKSINTNFMSKIAKLVDLHKIVLIIPSAVYQMILRNVLNQKQTDGWGIAHKLIINELKKDEATMILQNTQEGTIEQTFEYFEEMTKNEINKDCKLFVLGSLKDYLKIPTIDVFALEQLIK